MDFNKLTHRVHFYNKVEANEFMPSTHVEEVEVFSCYARVDNVFLKDLEQAKANGSINDLTVIIRDTQGEFMPQDNMVFTIDGKTFSSKKYEVKSVQPFYQDGRFIAVIGADAS